jgi:AraC-like DNA-binding protein
VATSRSIASAKDVIDARYAEPLDVPTLARVARLSPAHFSREFRRAFDVSPHRYLAARRMGAAAELLRTTERPVGEICRAVGLRSVGSFTTRFTRTFGLSPSAYRQRHRRTS